MTKSNIPDGWPTPVERQDWAYGWTRHRKHGHLKAAILLRAAHCDGQGLGWFETIQTTMKATGLTRTSLVKNRQQLVEDGLLKIEPKPFQGIPAFHPCFDLIPPPEDLKAAPRLIEQKAVTRPPISRGAAPISRGAAPEREVNGNVNRKPHHHPSTGVACEKCGRVKEPDAQRPEWCHECASSMRLADRIREGRGLRA